MTANRTARPMKTQNDLSSKVPATARKNGFTLIEVTFLVGILMGLIIILFIGAREFKKGSDRAACIQNISSMQRIVRSYGNLYGVFPGETVSGLKSELVGPGKFLEVEPSCPADGTYTYSGDTLPQPGVLYLDCSLGDHEPQLYDSW